MDRGGVCGKYKLLYLKDKGKTEKEASPPIFADRLLPAAAPRGEEGSEGVGKKRLRRLQKALPLFGKSTVPFREKRGIPAGGGQGFSGPGAVPSAGEVARR